MPLANQNIILNLCRDIKKANNDTVEYFKPLAFSSIETENVIEEKVNMKREKPSIRADRQKMPLSYKVTPYQFHIPYYFFTPVFDLKPRLLLVLLNNSYCSMLKFSTQRQTGEADRIKLNQETVIEFRFRTDHIDMS
ncbi:MAG: hypothetical protein ACLRZG_04730 [Streptococcus sp.]